MKKVTLYVSGNVQSVGYRVKVESIARSLGIKGFVQNLPDSRVKIIAQGKQADLDKLIQNINISNSLINVTNIEQKYSNLSEDFEDFNKVVSEGETDEKLDIAIGLFKELITVNKDGFDGLGKKLGDKIDPVGEKVDHVGSKTDQSRIEITSEIHSLSDDFNTLFDKR